MDQDFDEFEEQMQDVSLEAKDNVTLKQENRRLHDQLKLLQMQLAKLQKATSKYNDFLT